MKILAVSDMVVDRLYSEKVGEYFSDVEMVLGCGDLPYEYLEFLNYALNVPVLYVPGNHDPAYNINNHKAHAAGCEHLDQRVQRVKGLNIGGIGGSIRYKPGHPNQYTQAQMYSRFIPLIWRLAGRLFRRSGLDLMIAHSPPYGIHDDDDLPHTGFHAFQDFIRIFKPRYFLHGHTVVYKNNIVPPVTRVGATTVINVYPYRIIEIET